MRIYELELPPTYLCSDTKITIGSTTEQHHACDLGASHEGALERRRPSHALCRGSSLQLYTDPEQNAEYVYRVEPIGQVDRYHTSWLIRLGQTDEKNGGELDQFAAGFWSGKEIPEDRDAPWEYRAMEAKIVQRVGGRALRVVD